MELVHMGKLMENLSVTRSGPLKGTGKTSASSSPGIRACHALILIPLSDK